MVIRSVAAIKASRAGTPAAGQLTLRKSGHLNLAKSGHYYLASTCTKSGHFFYVKFRNPAHRYQMTARLDKDVLAAVQAAPSNELTGARRAQALLRRAREQFCAMRICIKLFPVGL
jgi:hypothetical protein